jgi:hypothetical protein
MSMATIEIVPAVAGINPVIPDPANRKKGG